MASFKRIALFAMGITACAPSPALAWGDVGHAVIADLAEARLTPRAAGEARRLLATEGAVHLAGVASWADAVKGAPGSPNHSVRLPLDGGPAPPHPCPSGFCADEALTRYEHVLADRSRPEAERAVALKYVVHLVGDLHQPLHAVDATGSHLPVLFDGRPTTLHKVWDGGIIRAHGGSPGVIADALRPLAGRVPAGGGPRDWAEEGRRIAQTDIYADIDPRARDTVILPRSYARRQWPVVARRLAQAGDRLAALLNRCLG